MVQQSGSNRLRELELETGLCLKHRRFRWVLGNASSAKQETGQEMGGNERGAFEEVSAKLLLSQVTGGAQEF